MFPSFGGLGNFPIVESHYAHGPQMFWSQNTFALWKMGNPESFCLCGFHLLIFTMVKSQSWEISTPYCSIILVSMFKKSLKKFFHFPNPSLFDRPFRICTRKSSFMHRNLFYKLLKEILLSGCELEMSLLLDCGIGRMPYKQSRT